MLHGFRYAGAGGEYVWSLGASGSLSLRGDADEHWQLALFATNLMDKRYRINGSDSLEDVGYAVAEYGRPREWSVTGTWRF